MRFKGLFYYQSNHRTIIVLLYLSLKVISFICQQAQGLLYLGRHLVMQGKRDQCASKIILLLR